jgi:hypothetical protein
MDAPTSDLEVRVGVDDGLDPLVGGLGKIEFVHHLVLSTGDQVLGPGEPL